MPELKDFIKEYRESNGWSQTEIASKIGVSSQLYGRYEAGKHGPKSDFYEGWKKAFGFDLIERLKQMSEPNVSRGAEKITPAMNSTDKIDYDEGARGKVYKTIVEGHTEYLLIPRSVMKDVQLVSNKQIEKDKIFMDALIEFNRELLTKIPNIPKVQKS